MSKKQKVLSVNMSEQARQLIIDAAKATDMKTVDFIRYAATRCAQQVLEAKQGKGD